MLEMKLFLNVTSANEFKEQAESLARITPTSPQNGRCLTINHSTNVCGESCSQYTKLLETRLIAFDLD
jgi:hypothetical protein